MGRKPSEFEVWLRHPVKVREQFGAHRSLEEKWGFITRAPDAYGGADDRYRGAVDVVVVETTEGDPWPRLILSNGVHHYSKRQSACYWWYPDEPPPEGHDR